MTLSARNAEDVVNLALTRIGYSPMIQNMMEGTRAADAALNVYAQTRDDALREGNWEFAKRTVAMTLLKQAPPGGYIPPTSWDPATYPPPGWLYEYGYPDDCLKVRSVRPSPLLFIINFDPQPNLFSIQSDNAYIPARKVILTNVADAVLTYVGQVTNPLTWEASFTEALAASLGRRLAVSLTDMNGAKMEAADEQVSTAKATATQG